MTPRGPARDAWRRLRANRGATACLVGFAVIVVACAVGPVVCGWFGLDATRLDLELLAAAPSPAHPLGTDNLGRDLLVRVLVGGRIAIAMGLFATAVALVIGVTWGATAAYLGGRVDDVMMRVVDTLYGFPIIPFVVVVRAVFDTRSLVSLFLLIGSISWLTMARIVRGQVLSLRHREFVEAARALGASRGRILWRHIIPNTAGPVVVYATVLVPQTMLIETFMSFIGLGVQAPLASWGTLVTEGSTQVAVSPWVLAGPAVAMGATIFALNFLGDGLRDALDPRGAR
ncbi:MAG: ABC transporter permease [Kofleriaceae bacterium]